MKKDFFDQTKKIRTINIASRLTLAFVFLYHGLIPKIIWLSRTETLLVAAHKLPFGATLLPYLAGTLEITLSLFIAIYRVSLLPIYIAAFVLVILLLDVAMYMPSLLIEAFNPVSINIACLCICATIILSHQQRT